MSVFVRLLNVETGEISYLGDPMRFAGVGLPEGYVYLDDLSTDDWIQLYRQKCGYKECEDERIRI